MHSLDLRSITERTIKNIIPAGSRRVINLSKIAPHKLGIDLMKHYPSKEYALLTETEGLCMTKTQVKQELGVLIIKSMYNIHSLALFGHFIKSPTIQTMCIQLIDEIPDEPRMISPLEDKNILITCYDGIAYYTELVGSTIDEIHSNIDSYTETTAQLMAENRRHMVEKPMYN